MDSPYTMLIASKTNSQKLCLLFQYFWAHINTCSSTVYLHFSVTEECNSTKICTVMSDVGREYCYMSISSMGHAIQLLEYHPFLMQMRKLQVEVHLFSAQRRMVSELFLRLCHHIAPFTIVLKGPRKQSFQHKRYLLYSRFHLHWTIVYSVPWCFHMKKVIEQSIYTNCSTQMKSAVQQTSLCWMFCDYSVWKSHGMEYTNYSMQVKSALLQISFLFENMFHSVNNCFECNTDFWTEEKPAALPIAILFEMEVETWLLSSSILPLHTIIIQITATVDYI